MFDNEDIFIDTDLIKSALNEIKENPNIQTVARFDDDGNYVIKKIKQEKLSFRERIKYGGKSKNTYLTKDITAREYGKYMNKNGHSDYMDER